MELFNIKSQNYYFINGLRRSGNHFFISWIISNYKRVLFINDVNSKPILDKKYHKKELSDKIVFREKNQFVDSINNNLISNKENINDLKEIDCLIFSMEDKKLDTFYKTIKYFDKIIHKRPVSTYFKVIVIRDLLNLMASRLEAIKNLSDKNKIIDQFKIDQYFIDIWMNMIIDKKSVLFNYNKFILDYGDYREEIGKKLKLPVLSDDILLKVPQFFFGSSFNPNSQSRSKIHDLLNRYKKHQSNKFILSIINNAKIMNILIKDFSINYKVAFMFLTINDIEYENMWNDYFNTEKDSINKFNIYLFSKYPAEIKSVFKYYLINNKYSTIINNYKILFKEAIDDDLLNKYFIILQDTDIPKYKFNIFYKFLIEKVKENNTIELLKFNKGNSFIENKKFNLIKHTPYSILNRKSIINILKSPYLKYFDYNKVADEYYLSLIYNKMGFKNRVVTYCDWYKYNKYREFIKNKDIKYKKLSAKYHTFLNEYYRLDIAHEDLTSKVNKKNTFFERKIKHFR